MATMVFIGILKFALSFAGAWVQRVVPQAGLLGSLAGIGITLAGGTMVAASLDVAAGAFQGSQVGLAPIARLLGEGTLRPITGTLISAFEGLLFGAGLAFGLTHRPRLR